MVHWNIAQWRAVDDRKLLTFKKLIKKGHLLWQRQVIGWSALTKMCLICGLSKSTGLPFLVARVSATTNAFNR